MTKSDENMSAIIGLLIVIAVFFGGILIGRGL